MKKIINKFEIIFVIFGYFIINLIFNYHIFWNQLYNDYSKIGGVYGEVQAYEWLTEKFYENLIAGHNPFGLIKNMLYPFGFNLGLVDAGNGLFFLPFKAFLSTHQSMSIIIALSLLMANIGMYLLLKKLNINKLLSFIIGAAFGYMTFLMPRGGHLSYWCHFLFPWFYLFIISFLTAKTKLKKILNIIGSSIVFVLTLWMNFYYFVMLLISIFCLLLFYFVFNTKLFILKFKKNLSYLLLKGIIIFILLIPWFIALYDMFIFDQVPRTNGWGGAIEFASDLFNYFLPSGYSNLFTKFPILIKPFSLLLKLYTPNARSIFENFTYPGVIILFSFFILFLFYKKIKRDILKQLWPFLFTSIVFLILTLGPFLHVFGHWTLTVDEGIKIVIPLPYIILHYIPFLNNVRVPGRIIVAFIFFGYIVAGYILNYFIFTKVKKKITRNLLLIFLFVIFFIDQQYYVDPNAPQPQIYPNKIYNIIKTDKEKSTVLEIPFTVRDGFTYFGDGDAFQMIIGESIHGKQVLGGYTGRIADYKKAYYQNNPLTGYFGRVIDGDYIKNPGIEKINLDKWQKLDIAASKKAIDFLDLKYIITNDERKYMATLSADLKSLGFIKIKTENKYSLWQRSVKNNEFLYINLPDFFSSIYLGFGWQYPESEFRWADRRSSVMFKVINPRKMTLNFTAASFNKDQYVTIYLNKKKIGKLFLTQQMKKYELPISKKLDKDINTIYFIFDNDFRPSDVIPGSQDKRQLSGKFSQIYLTDTK